MAALTPRDILSQRQVEREADKLGVDLRDPSQAKEYVMVSTGSFCEVGRVFDGGTNVVSLFDEDVQRISHLVRKPEIAEEVRQAEKLFEKKASADTKKGPMPSLPGAFFTVTNGMDLPPIISLRLKSEVDAEAAKAADAKAKKA